MIELRTLIRLRLRQWQHRLTHLLRLFGYNPNDRSLKEFFYNLYLLFFFIFWVVIGSWGAVVYQAVQIGKSLSPLLWERILSGLPWAVFLTVVGLSLRFARQTPLALSFPDIAYIAGSPMPRRTITHVQFWQKNLQAMLIVLPVAAVTAVALAQPAAATAGSWASVRAVIVAILLTLLTSGTAWLWGIKRLSHSAWVQWPGYVWTPLALLIGGIAAPKIALWPGKLWINALLGSWTLGEMLLLVLLVGVVLAVLVWIGDQANLIVAADESRSYARVQALGAFARLSPELAPELRAVQQQKRMVGKRPFLQLPTTSGSFTLLVRSGLTLLRQGSAPFALALWGAIFTGSAQLILSSNAPPEFWIYWMFGLLLFPPRWLASSFQADLREPFLRQFLPLAHWQLLVLDTAVPFACLLIGALAVWLMQPILSPLLIILVSILLVLCLGVSSLRVTPWRIQIPYPATAFVTIGGIVAVGIFGSGLAAIMTAITAVFLLSAAIIFS
ncbi:MAG: hypothetical protein H6667_22185 [Ardenticatenaceae bacterium]|nr:hypothetical protein [Ardenticatenaceae bacterium]MCB9444448.1 hypothetical protein [Ardenticatenaceae bacterium]